MTKGVCRVCGAPAMRPTGAICQVDRRAFFDSTQKHPDAQIARMVAEGKTRKDIAEELGVSLSRAGQLVGRMKGHAADAARVTPDADDAVLWEAIGA